MGETISLAGSQFSASSKTFLLTKNIKKKKRKKVIQSFKIKKGLKYKKKLVVFAIILEDEPWASWSLSKWTIIKIRRIKGRKKWTEKKSLRVNSWIENPSQIQITNLGPI